MTTTLPDDATALLRNSSSVEMRAYRAARSKCEERGRKRKFPYASFDAFLADVGPRPPGQFVSGRSMHALFRRDDGRYEWRRIR